MDSDTKKFRAQLRYSYRNLALNMLGRIDWKNLTPDEIKRLLESIIQTYYPIRPYKSGSFDKMTQDEFMSIIRDTFKLEIKRMKS